MAADHTTLTWKFERTHNDLVQEAYETTVLGLLNLFFADFNTEPAMAKQNLQSGMARARQARTQALIAIEE